MTDYYAILNKMGQTLFITVLKDKTIEEAISSYPTAHTFVKVKEICFNSIVGIDGIPYKKLCNMTDGEQKLFFNKSYALYKWVPNIKVTQDMEVSIMREKETESKKAFLEYAIEQMKNCLNCEHGGLNYDGLLCKSDKECKRKLNNVLKPDLWELKA